MSGLPDTFPCPWCGMSYPAKPVLVGKAVRCKGCRNGFILQPDGVASKIQEAPPSNATVSQVSSAAAPPASAAIPAAKPPAPTPAPAPMPTPPAPKPTPPAPKPTLPAPKPTLPAPKPVPVKAAVVEEIVVLPQRDAPKPAAKLAPVKAAVVEEVEVLPQRPPSTPKPEPKSDKVVKKKAEHLEAARAQMAAQLAGIAAQAADSEAAKREERKDKSERIVKGGKPASTAQSARHAVLTGEGERHHSERRLWWLWLGVGAAIVLLLLFVFNLSSATRQAIEVYAAPVSAEQNRYPVLGDVLRARAWLAAAHSMPGGPVLATGLADASFGAERTIDLTALTPKLAELKGLRLEAALGLWLAPGDLEKARAAAGGKTGAEAAKQLTTARIRHLVHAQVQQGWSLPEEDAAILLDLLTGTPPREGEPIAKRMLDQGELPDRLVLRTFRGRNGSMLVDIGRPPYRPVQGAYTGVILRFEGSRWPIGWKVLHLNQVK